MRGFYALFLGLLSFSSCTKESVGINGSKCFFKYTVDGSTGGYEGNYSILLGQWLNGMYTAGSGSNPLLMANRSVDCNVNGKPPCFSADIFLPTLAKGKFKFGDPGVLFFLKENRYSSVSDYSYTMDEYTGTGSVTVTQVGDVGGNVNGSFTGQAMKYDYYGNEVKLVPVSGSFSLYRVW